MWPGAISILADEMKEEAVPFNAVIEFLASYDCEWAIAIRETADS